MTVSLIQRGRFLPLPELQQRDQRGVGEEAVVRLARAGIVRTGLMASSWEYRLEQGGVGIWGQHYSRYVDARGRHAGFIDRVLDA